MTLSGRERATLQHQVREAILEHYERGNGYIKVKQIRSAIDDEFSYQAVSNIVSHLVDDGDLEPWRGTNRSSSSTYRITLEFYGCEICGTGHTDRGTALECCSEFFDGQRTAPGTITVRGTAPRTADDAEAGDAA